MVRFGNAASLGVEGLAADEQSAIWPDFLGQLLQRVMRQTTAW